MKTACTRARLVACIILSSVANLFNLCALCFVWLAYKAAPKELGLRPPTIK